MKGVVAAVLLATPLIALTRAQSALYVDAETLYRATIAHDPGSWLALNNLGVLELDRAPADAIAHFIEAIRHNPSYADAHFNLARAYHGMGKLDAAMTEYAETIRLKPARADAHDNLASALAASGRLGDAEREYRLALSLNPRLAGAHTNLGLVLGLTGRLDEAIVEHQAALAIDPTLEAARRNLANAEKARGR